MLGNACNATLLGVTRGLRAFRGRDHDIRLASTTRRVRLRRHPTLQPTARTRAQGASLRIRANTFDPHVQLAPSDARRDAQAGVPSAEWHRAQLAFKNSMIHGILQFTSSIAFRYVLHRYGSQDIRCRES
jgi:hypothetical protein